MTLLDRVFRASQVFRSYPLCHSLPERSFRHHGRYFGLCARCTTLYLGGAIALLLAPLWMEIVDGWTALVVGSVLLGPGTIDGFTQLLGERESTNRLRAITGLLMGLGIPLLAYWSIETLSAFF